MIGEINKGDAVAAVKDCFERYNAALDIGDTDALNGFFWNSASTIRFGSTETLVGYEEISAFRSRKWKGSPGGRVLELVVVTAFGSDVATTNAVFRGADGSASRQSQTWVNLREGWRIVAAHVSAGPP